MASKHPIARSMSLRSRHRREPVLELNSPQGETMRSKVVRLATTTRRQCDAIASRRLVTVRCDLSTPARCRRQVRPPTTKACDSLCRESSCRAPPLHENRYISSRRSVLEESLLSSRRLWSLTDCCRLSHGVAPPFSMEQIGKLAGACACVTG